MSLQGYARYVDEPRLLDGRLKIKHLLLVDAVTRLGTVVGAAGFLHITQPVATRSLHELESILGVTLYERGPRGVRPTIYGQAFTQHARAVLAQLVQAQKHIAELADADRGTVVVGSHLAGSNILLPRAIATLKTERPQLTVIVREGTPEVLLAELEAGKVDLIVGRLTSHSDSRVIRITLYSESVRLVTRVDHPLTELKEVKFSDTAGYPWIFPGVETALRSELEEFFARNDMQLPTNRVDATSFLTVRQLLLETDMVAALPSLIPRADTRLTTLPVTLDQISHRVGLTLAVNRPLNPSADALVARLHKTADDIASPRLES